MTGLETLRLELDEDPELRGAMDLLKAHHATEGVVSGAGLESIIAGATLGVSKKTWILPGLREKACGLLRGASADRLQATRPYRVLPPGESPAQRALSGVGLSLTGDPVLVFLGTGSLSYGAALEALSLAVTQKAPVCFVVSWYEGEGPFAPQLSADPSVVAGSLGLSTAVVDGRDAAAVRAAVSGPLPRLVQANLRGRA
jgi:TPP-dependent pyruvate/acetoin dehydrogenase alpha subunit